MLEAHKHLSAGVAQTNTTTSVRVAANWCAGATNSVVGARALRCVCTILDTGLLSDAKCLNKLRTCHPEPILAPRPATAQRVNHGASG